MKITDRIREVEVAKADGLSTMLTSVCEGGLILVDVGFTELCIANIEAELMISEKVEDIAYTITHAHGDHIENLPRSRPHRRTRGQLGQATERLLDETGQKLIWIEQGDHRRLQV
jgi:glyoxylase-like metal-dependent hydrolase (beta-lactamase superfamily II)